MRVWPYQIYFKSQKTLFVFSAFLKKVQYQAVQMSHMFLALKRFRLQYPLLFSYGQTGWHCGIQKLHRAKNISKKTGLLQLEQLASIQNFVSVDGYLEMKDQVLQKGKRKRDSISVREYYCYKFQMRNDDEDEILHTSRLFQQYSVDEYIKLETQRLDFVFFN